MFRELTLPTSRDKILCKRGYMDSKLRTTGPVIKSEVEEVSNPERERQMRRH